MPKVRPGVKPIASTPSVSETLNGLNWTLVDPEAVRRSRVGPIQTASKLTELPTSNSGATSLRSSSTVKFPFAPAVPMRDPACSIISGLL